MASKIWACICNCNADKVEQRRIHREIEKELKKDKKETNRSFKLLLLGTGGSGKSTFIKQMRIIHGNGYSQQERDYFRQLVFQNMFSTLQTLAQSMQDRGVMFKVSESEKWTRLLFAMNPETITELSHAQQNMARVLWQDAGVRGTFDQRFELQLPVSDASVSFLEDTTRVFCSNYVPTLSDILRVRVPTTGITEYPFHLDGAVFRMVDVGGQRSERRKWIHCFEDCTSIIFVTACSEYDETIIDIDIQNRMAESLALFQTIISYPWFHKSSIILFMNKKDLLEEKVVTVDFKSHFPSYSGPPRDYIRIRQHILEMFSSLNPDPSRVIYPHFTCATDTENIRFVFSAIKDTIIMLSLKQYNLM
eukprot:scpid41240/ scgid0768/ Guanine nucleotide-binding protein subunit alpha-11